MDAADLFVISLVGCFESVIELTRFAWVGSCPGQVLELTRVSWVGSWAFPGFVCQLFLWAGSRVDPDILGRFWGSPGHSEFVFVGCRALWLDVLAGCTCALVLV